MHSSRTETQMSGGSAAMLVRTNKEKKRADGCPAITIAKSKGLLASEGCYCAGGTTRSVYMPEKRFDMMGGGGKACVPVVDACVCYKHTCQKKRSATFFFAFLS